MTTEQEIELMGKGALQSPEDYRYVNVEHLAGAAPEDLSSFPQEGHVQFADRVPKLNQKKIGSCTNQTTAEMVTHRQIRLERSIGDLSPRFPYALSKVNDGIADKNEQGTFCNMSLKMAVKFGMATTTTCENNCDLSFDDYIFHRDVRNMTEASFTEADAIRIPGYAQVGAFGAVSAAQVVHAFNNAPDGVKFCIKIGREFWTDKDGNVTYDRAKLLPIRPMTEYVSGHDMWMTDYEIEAGTQRLKVFFRNHWSDQWCSTGGNSHDGGNGWFYLDEHPFTEAWTLSEIPDALLAIIKSLPAQKDFNHVWGTDLDPGSSSDDVKNLQIALKITGSFPFNQPVTTYFGNITKAAVMDFQKKYNVTTPEGIASAGGKVGPKTRETLNQLFSHK